VFSRVGRPAKFDYKITFQETQEMQLTRQRLYKTRTILDTSLITLKSLESFFYKKVQCCQSSDQMLGELDVLISKYKIHRVSIDRLLDIADGTMTLVCTTPVFNNLPLTCAI
jgi:hypothetical protein